jgi:outer membrane protein TolC
VLFFRYGHATSQLLVASMVALPISLSAQTSPSPQAADWRRANDEVGAYKRGHIDVLKWEKANAVAEAKVAASPNEVTLSSAEAAVRLAWQVHRELASPLARIGTQNEQLVAQGRWTELDPSLQRRIPHMDEVLEVAIAGRKAWIEAVAARQILKHQRELLDAAQAAHELGQRMVTVGNWSKLQLAPVQLSASNARMNFLRAQHAAAQTQSKLVKAMGKMGVQDSFLVPDELPPVPAQSTAEADLQLRGNAIRMNLPATERLRNRALAKEAMNTYWAAHALAQESQGEVLKTRAFITEETVLHYNGMLKSVWDLLNEVRNQSQATVDAIGAQRDFWIAEADLQWVLQGGEPDNFVLLGGAGGESPSPAH